MYALLKSLLLVFAASAAYGDDLDTSNTPFHLYTRSNPVASQPLFATPNSIMTSTFFQLGQPTVFTIHNFGENVGGNFNAFVVPALLDASNVNVIGVDWSAGSSLYTLGLVNARDAGNIVATFANILINTFGYSASQIRIVGVGLGGHIAGIAARNINGVVPHIFALDPSFHGWTHHPDILNADDADVVEVLHTTIGDMGYDYPLGDLDFYPNGGRFQNGCGLDTSCSHIYSYVFYAESLTAETTNGLTFVGTACDDYNQAITMQCSGNRDVTFGGSAVKTGVSGIYTFITNFVQPFARG